MGGDEVASLLDRAESNRKAGRFKQALEDLDTVLAKTPSYPKATAARADCLYNLRRKTEAREAAEGALRADRDLALPHVVLAFVLDDDGDTAGSAQHADAAITLAPNDAYTYACRGALATVHGRFRDAIPDLKRAVEIDPSLYDAQHNLAASLQGVRDLRGVYLQSKVLLKLRPNATNVIRFLAGLLWAHRPIFAGLVLIPFLFVFLRWPLLLLPHGVLLLVYVSAAIDALFRRQRTQFFRNLAFAMVVGFMSLAILAYSS